MYRKTRPVGQRIPSADLDDGTNDGTYTLKTRDERSETMISPDS